MYSSDWDVDETTRWLHQGQLHTSGTWAKPSSRKQGGCQYRESLAGWNGSGSSQREVSVQIASWALCFS